MKRLLQIVCLMIGACGLKGQTFSITQFYAMTNAIDNAARVKIVSFDFSSLLSGFEPTDISSINWNVTHNYGATSLLLSTDNPSGSSGSFLHSRWINVFGGLNGFIVPTGNDPQSRLWLNDTGVNFSFNSETSPRIFSYLPETRTQYFADLNTSRVAQYFEPFSIEIVASQAVGNWASPGKGNPRPNVYIDPAVVFGEVTIQITAIPEPSSAAFMIGGAVALVIFYRGRKRAW